MPLPNTNRPYYSAPDPAVQLAGPLILALAATLFQHLQQPNRFTNKVTGIRLYQPSVLRRVPFTHASTTLVYLQTPQPHHTTPSRARTGKTETRGRVEWRGVRPVFGDTVSRVFLFSELNYLTPDISLPFRPMRTACKWAARTCSLGRVLHFIFLDSLLTHALGTA